MAARGRPATTFHHPSIRLGNPPDQSNLGPPATGPHEGPQGSTSRKNKSARRTAPTRPPPAMHGPWVGNSGRVLAPRPLGLKGLAPLVWMLGWGKNREPIETIGYLHPRRPRTPSMSRCIALPTTTGARPKYGRIQAAGTGSLCLSRLQSTRMFSYPRLAWTVDPRQDPELRSSTSNAPGFMPPRLAPVAAVLPPGPPLLSASSLNTRTSKYCVTCVRDARRLRHE